MGEVEAKKDRVTRHEFRHDRYAGSLQTDHLAFSPKYRGRCSKVKWLRRRRNCNGCGKGKSAQNRIHNALYQIFSCLQAPYLSTGYRYLEGEP